ncbi:MAG: nicotinate (nicotinamide) nucleotide adenylyltransferase [Flavobacteriales bacterium]|nr:nicotinate (nicotinamide) nucleotide adenylyltransferase [Flavobacteriales bacterium]
MKIGCLFGTFDPPHLGHLSVAQAALNGAHLDQVWFVVTPRNPFKQGRSISAEHHRLTMVRKLVRGRKGMHACAEELSLPTPNYTATSLAHFRRIWPDHQFSLIIGEDNLIGFRGWHEYKEILRHHDLIVYPRSGRTRSNAQAALKGASIRWLQQPLVPVSSTQVREVARQGREPKGLLTPAVQSYIEQEGLYAS